MNPNSSSDRWKVWTPLLFSLVLISGMILGFNLRDTLRNKRDIIQVVQRNDRLEEIIDLVNEKYVDTVNSNSLYKEAVSGILKSLDPHTVYIAAEDLQAVNDDLEGGFSGIGVEFSILRDTIEVTSVVENGPASRAGVNIGDKLIKVGDSIVAGNNISADRIVHLLKGKQRSKVNITFKLLADGSLKQVPIVRDIIPLHSVDAGIMLDSITAFIKINKFGATTLAEFNSALSALKGKGAKQLVLDLRDNGGGYLEVATGIADAFLDDHKLVVFTQGEHTPKKEYRAGSDGGFEQGKLAILVNERSASASEILSGAVQDWDRGVIIGRRTFGKGLVQEQYEMPDGAALRLTIARYYTPSGRCIQRSFAEGNDAYMQDYEKRVEMGIITGTDTAAPTDTMRFYTSKNRVVYGGGGIKPDVYVPVDTARISRPLIAVLYSDDLKGAIWDYFIQHRANLRFNSITDYTSSFNSQKDIITAYLNRLNKDDLKEVIKVLSNPTDLDYLKLQIKAQVARFLFHDNGYYAVLVKEDHAVNKALTVMNTPLYSRIISGK